MSADRKPIEPSKLTKRFLRLNLARQDFLGVMALAQQLVAESLQPTDSRFRPLMAGMVVTYARSFRQNDGIGALGQSFVRFIDAVLQDTHDRLLRVRDGLYAHRDTSKSFTSKAADAGRLYRTRIRIDKWTDSRVEYSVCSGAPELNPENLPNIVRLCAFQSDRVEVEMNKLWRVLTNGKQYACRTYTFGVDFP